MQVLEHVSRKFNTLHGEVNRAHLNFHPGLMVCSRSEWFLEGFQCSASLGTELPVEWMQRRRSVCAAPLMYSAPELILAEHHAEPLVASGALDCWAVGVTLFQLFFKKEAAEHLSLSGDQVGPCIAALFAQWTVLGARACNSLMRLQSHLSKGEAAVHNDSRIDLTIFLCAQVAKVYCEVDVVHVGLAR